MSQREVALPGSTKRIEIASFCIVDVRNHCLIINLMPHEERLWCVVAAMSLYEVCHNVWRWSK